MGGGWSARLCLGPDLQLPEILAVCWFVLGFLILSENSFIIRHAHTLLTQKKKNPWLATCEPPDNTLYTQRSHKQTSVASGSGGFTPWGVRRRSQLEGTVKRKRLSEIWQMFFLVHFYSNSDLFFISIWLCVSQPCCSSQKTRTQSSSLSPCRSLGPRQEMRQLFLYVVQMSHSLSLSSHLSASSFFLMNVCCVLRTPAG